METSVQSTTTPTKTSGPIYTALPIVTSTPIPVGTPYPTGQYSSCAPDGSNLLGKNPYICKEGLYCFNTGTKSYPNGICVAPQGKYLGVLVRNSGDYQKNEIEVYVNKPDAGRLDWVGVYNKDGSSYLDWKWLNNTKVTPVSATSSARLTFSVSDNAVHTYDIKLFSNNSFNVIEAVTVARTGSF
jgi:hypothetical protein